jgi:hypothetical protein
MKNKRTIVVSDIHGFPELLENALAHAGFDPASDTLVFAGDFLDRGPDSDRCLQLLEEAGAVMLVGNHEEGVLLDFWISDVAPDGHRFRETIREHVLSGDPERRWGIAYAVDSVLVTHAGVSAIWQREFDERCGGDATVLARLLGERFLETVKHQLDCGDVDFDNDPLLGRNGPLWWRFWERGSVPPLDGCVQVFGHTPVDMLAQPDGSLQRMDLFSIDPHVYAYHASNRPPAGKCKYAVIEGGDVTIVEVEGVRATAQAAAGERTP